jgi:hypothetical protein
MHNGEVSFVQEAAMGKKQVALLCAALLSVSAGLAGFKVKLVQPKKPDRFQSQVTVAGVTYAADLLLDSGEQKKFFYKELNRSNVIAVRLAVFNSSRGEVVLPLQSIQLLGPGGEELPPVAPLAVAEAVLQGRMVVAGASKNPPVAISPNMRTGDPRMDPSDPRYDPTMDPSRPTYDPNDPRNRYPNDPRYGGPWYRPGVDVVLSPGGGSAADLTEHERALVIKDFEDKAHTTEPVLSPQTRDRFLYFSASPVPANSKGIRLRLTPSKGIPTEIVLEF